MEPLKSGYKQPIANLSPTPKLPQYKREIPLKILNAF